MSLQDYVLDSKLNGPDWFGFVETITPVSHSTTYHFIGASVFLMVTVHYQKVLTSSG
jgi:hypothetical protein